MSNGSSGLFHQLSQNSSSEPESPKPDLLNVSHHNSTTNTTNNNNNEDEFIAKPKAREWEKHKVPWMDELKASQAKKTTTTSPNVNESKSPEHSSVSSSTANHANHEESKFESISKSFHSGSVTSSSSTTSSVSASGRTRLSERAATADVTSSTTSNHHMNSSFDLIASSRKEVTSSSSHQQHSLAAASNSVEQTSSSMTKSMSALSTKIAISSDAAAETTAPAPAATAAAPPVANARPLSVNLRNRSISPTPITRNTKTIHIPATAAESNGTSAAPVTSDNVCSRVQDLEAKVNRMERALNAQNGLIEELKRALRDESDKVRTLQKELEKYAQCVTQV